MESLVDRLIIRARIRRNAVGRKSVQEGAPDRIADLLEESADHIMNLENEVAQLRSIIKGDWPGCIESELNELLDKAIVNKVSLTDKQFEALFKKLDDRLLFKFLAKYMSNCQMFGHASYSVVGDIDNLRAVVEQTLYEKLTGRE